MYQYVTQQAHFNIEEAFLEGYFNNYSNMQMVKGWGLRADDGGGGHADAAVQREHGRGGGAPPGPQRGPRPAALASYGDALHLPAYCLAVRSPAACQPGTLPRAAHPYLLPTVVWNLLWNLKLFCSNPKA